MRLDKKLVDKNYFETRSKALFAIENKNIYVNGKCITKSSFDIKEDDIIEVRGETLKFVSKGGLKLEKAIKEFDIKLNNKIVLDIGSSTGGFCDCLLQNGAQKIYAVDVGTNQLDKKLRNDNRIKLYENTDFRKISIAEIKCANFITIDVSFISVIKLLEKIKKLEEVTEIICLIKPQFECGKELADKYKGIPRNKKIHLDVIENVVSYFNEINFNIENFTFSPITGGDGNIEYLAYFIKNNSKKSIDYNEIVNNAFNSI